MTQGIAQVETLIRTSLALAAEHDPVPIRPVLPVAALDRQRPRRRYRRVTAAAVCGAAVLAVGGVAAATGLIPSVITRGFGTNPNGTSMRDARIVAQTVTPDGIAIQQWAGHNSAGGYCEMDIALSPAGKTLDKSTGCASSPAIKFMKYTARAQWSELSQGGRKPGLIYVEAQTTVRAVTAIDVTIGATTIPMTYTTATGRALAYVPPTLLASGGYVTAYSGRHHIEWKAELGTPPPN